MQKRKRQSVRLSKNIVPIKYDIKLHPDLENFTFRGEEVITVDLKKETKEITLHSKEIDIETARIGEEFTKKISYNQKSETATFVFAKKIKKGMHTLTITFQGILNDKMRGFYKSSYIYEGKVHHIATTQFEATDARRAFPCFDEPAQKAVFHVSLVVPKGKTAISNTLPISKIEHEAGFEVIKFSPTPKMSTYLLAFIVGDFEYIEKKSKRGVLVRVYTTAGKKHQAKFSLDTTVKMLDFYEKYFNIPYPLNTLDMIAIPDFSSLAMENWGAITFREVGLLVDEKHTSTGSKELIAEVIAHELAHQWFGNLVTMEWWTHLWLNEGFASYIPYLAIEKVFPKWNIWERFVTNSHGTGSALRLDSLVNTHPIEVEVYHPDEIGEIFDEVSYAKGASVIRMLAEYIGEKNFRDGLRYYLKKHSYKNTETVHLWQAFEKVSGLPVQKMMQNWTGKSGYPLIRASLTSPLGTPSTKLILSQERFFLSPVSKAKSKDKTIWQIPITLQFKNSSKNLVQKHFLSRLSQAVELRMSDFSPEKYATAKKVVSNDFCIKINADEAGFYRVAYSKELLDKLHSPVAKKILSPIDRLGIVRDLFALAEAGEIETTEVLQFLSAYKNEDSFIVWTEIAGGISRLEQLLAKTSAKDDLKKFIIKLFLPVFKRLGWNKKKNEEHSDTLLRTIAISKLGRAGHSSVIKEARKRFASLKRGAHMNPDLRSVIYRVVAIRGGKKEFDYFIKKYKEETLHEEKNRIGGTLGDFQSDKILCETANFALSPHVRTQDTPSILAGLALNPLGRMIWLKCIKYNWDTFLSRYGDGGHTLSHLIQPIAVSPEKKHLEYFKTFFASRPAPGALRTIEQVLERMENNVLWLSRNGKKISKYLYGRKI